jgi:replicative DNA helicase
MTGGFKPGSLYILAARPGMGKTALALNVAERVAMPRDTEPRIVPVFSLEMSKEELIDRLICSRARVNTKKLDGGWMSAEETARVGRVAGEIAAADSLLIDDKANTNTQEIHAKIRKQQARGPVALVVVDYLQLLINAENDKERVAATSRISRDLKLIAKDCRVPLVALSQLNRKCEERGSSSNPDGYRPMLQDLRESGSIEQDADVVMSLVRLEVYLKENAELRGMADLEILKQRGGPIGRIPLTWVGEIVRFEQGGAQEQEAA